MTGIIVRIVVPSGLFAAGAAVLGSPIGAAGGAIYGATSGVLNVVVGGILGNVLTNERVSREAKAAIELISIVFGVLATWKLAALFGVNMTLKSAVVLTLTSVGIGIGVGAAVCLIAGSVALVATCVLSKRN